MKLFIRRVSSLTLGKIFSNYRLNTSNAAWTTYSSAFLSTTPRPVKPPNSFGLFLIEKRSEYDGKDFFKKIAVQWKVLPDEEKTIYIHNAKSSMDTYKESLKLLSDFERDQIEQERKRKKSVKAKLKQQKLKTSTGMPKHPRSSYAYFVKEASAKDVTLIYGKKDMPSTWKKLAIAWNQLSEDEKQKYTDMAEKDKARYLEEMEAYVSKLRGSEMEYLIPKKYFNKWTEPEEKAWDDVIKVSPKK